MQQNTSRKSYKHYMMIKNETEKVYNSCEQGQDQNNKIYDEAEIRNHQGKPQ